MHGLSILTENLYQNNNLFRNTQNTQIYQMGQRYRIDCAKKSSIAIVSIMQRLYFHQTPQLSLKDKMSAQ